MTVQIFEVEIWSDEVTEMEALDIVALLKRIQTGQDLIPVYVVLTYTASKTEHYAAV
jgi:hypothetical protein